MVISVEFPAISSSKIIFPCICFFSPLLSWTPAIFNYFSFPLRVRASAVLWKLLNIRKSRAKNKTDKFVWGHSIGTGVDHNNPLSYSTTCTSKPVVHIPFSSAISVKDSRPCLCNVLFLECEGLPLWVFWAVSLIVPLPVVWPALLLEGPFSIWRKLFLLQSEPDPQLEVV